MKIMAVSENDCFKTLKMTLLVVSKVTDYITQMLSPTSLGTRQYRPHLHHLGKGLSIIFQQLKLPDVIPEINKELKKGWLLFKKTVLFAMRRLFIFFDKKLKNLKILKLPVEFHSKCNTKKKRRKQRLN